MSPELREEWPMWRLVRAQWATLRELETTWSLDDVMRANALLDMERDAESVAAEERRRREGSKS